MKYALLIYFTPDAYDGLDADAQSAVTAEYMEIAADDRVIAGEQLAGLETATSVRVANGETLTTDGPFAETKEVFGGFFLLDAPDIDDALELAARIPAARMGGVVEVRPLMERPS